VGNTVFRLAGSVPVLFGLLTASSVFGQAHYRHRNHHAKSHSNVVFQTRSTPAAGQIQVDITPTHALNKFAPNLALGASVDALGIGGRTENFSSFNVAKMLTAGNGSVSYRLYTDLNVEDWHWNPTGTWSDTINKQGYFVGSATPGAAILDSYGYLATHRGDTFDQGDNLDYSRLDDGDTSTYWKSNPYLTTKYTGEPDTLHPQWILVDLGSRQDVNAIHIDWVNPYAVSYVVQYWTGDDALYDPTNGKWANFPNGAVSSGTGGTVTLKLSSSPVSAEFIRVLMQKSSGTFDTHGSVDPRNGFGYAVSEIGVGTVTSGGAFTDLVSHSADQNQTPIYVSSNDPWTTSKDQNQATEQVGLDFIYGNKLTRSLPMTIPVAMTYSTPDNAVAEVGYLSKKGYPIVGIELGEEPDGQFMSPEDYGALYVQWATAIHSAYPNYKLGGPVLSSSVVQTWSDALGNVDWMKRFAAYLISHNALSLLSFVSVEHYPFDATSTDWSLLSQEPGQLQDFFTSISNALIPKTTPVYITEYNFNSGGGEAPVDLTGALWQTIFVGEFLNRGGQGAFFYQYLPVQLNEDGSDWGILGMFTADQNDQAIGATAQYFSNLMMSQLWCLQGTSAHTVLPATSSIKDGSGNPLVYPYALARPGGDYSLMLVNVDSVAHPVQVKFTDSATHYFSGLGSRFWLTDSNYVWRPNGANGAATPAGPIQAIPVRNNKTTTYTLPPRSITVLTGKIQ